MTLFIGKDCPGHVVGAGELINFDPEVHWDLVHREFFTGHAGNVDERAMPLFVFEMALQT